MVHMYYYPRCTTELAFTQNTAPGHASIATEAKEQEVSDWLWRGQLYCFLRLGFE